MAGIQYGWKRVDSPAQTPAIDLDVLKRHCRLPLDDGYTDDDVLLTKYTNSAERLIEDQAEITLRTKEWEHWLSDLPGYECQPFPYDSRSGVRHNLVPIRLERPPVVTVDWVKYYDSDDELQTLDEDAYYLIDDASPPLLLFKTDLIPNIGELSQNRLDRWRIRMTTGSDRLDPTAEVAIMLLSAYYFRHPEDDGKAPPSSSTADRAFRDCVENLRWRAYP